MYTLMFDEAEARGEEKKAVEILKNLMESTKWTAKQLMDAAKIPADEQEKYAEKLAAGAATKPAMAEPSAQYDPV